MAWLGTWIHRIEITVDSSLIDTDLGHFRITLMLNSSTGKTNKDVTCIFDELGSNANRKKIAVTKADGTTQLYVEIEHWDDLREKAVLHVSKSDWTILAASDTDLVIYYDSSQADNTTYVSDSSNSNVWDANYKIANHMATYVWTEYKDADGVYTDADARPHLEEPTIVYDDGDWHMWVSPGEVPLEQGDYIDYLTSADNGLSFTRQGTTTIDIVTPHVYHNIDNDGLPISWALANDGGAWTVEATEANNATPNDMTLLPAVPVVNDAYYFAGSGDFHQIILNVGTAGEGTYTITWEYWDGDSWEALSDVVDNTNSFKTAGTNTVSWTVPAAMAKSTENGVNLYWVRARLSAYTANGYVQPKGTQAWIVYKFWLTGVPLDIENIYKDGVSLYVASTGTKFGGYKDEWLPRGAAEDWDYPWMGNRWMWKEGGSFHMWYEASDDFYVAWNEGFATSTDGLNWTKDGGNPVDTAALPARLTGGPTAIKIGSTYYLMTHHTLLYSTTNKTDFTALAGSSCPYIHRTLGGETSIHDPVILEVGASTYIYYNSGYNFINLVKIPTTASECLANYVASIRNAPDDADIKEAIYDSDGESAVSDTILSRGRKGVAGIAGTAMQFLGTGSIAIPQKSIVGNATFVARIKLYTIDKQNTIASLYEVGVVLPNYIFDITDSNFARLRFWKDGATVQTVTGDVALEAATWYTIIGTYDSTAEKLKIYINADLDEEAAATGTPNDIDRYFRVGAHQYGGGESAVYLEAILDELCILDTCKGPEWVKATHHNLNDSLLTYGDEEEYTPSGGGGLSQAALLLLG